VASAQLRHQRREPAWSVLATSLMSMRVSPPSSSPAPVEAPIAISGACRGNTGSSRTAQAHEWTVATAALATLQPMQAQLVPSRECGHRFAAARSSSRARGGVFAFPVSPCPHPSYGSVVLWLFIRRPPVEQDSLRHHARAPEDASGEWLRCRAGGFASRVGVLRADVKLFRSPTDRSATDRGGRWRLQLIPHASRSRRQAG